MKYKKAMEHLEMNDEMKSEILQNIVSGKTKTKRGYHWMKIAAFSLAGVLGLAVIIPALLNLTSHNNEKSAIAASAPYSGGAVMEDAAVSQEMNSPAPDAGTSAEKETGSLADQDTLVSDSAKRVYRANVSIQSKDFAKSVQTIQSLTEQMKGFISSQTTNSQPNEMKYGFFQVRIPTDQFSNFLDQLSETETVISSSQSADNITKNYYDTQGRIQSLTKERDRLNELMAKAETVSDLIAIESQLNEVETQLQWAQQDLSYMDLDLEYSTVNIDVQEVNVYSSTSASSWAAIPKAFSDTFYYFANGLGNVLVVLIYLAPWGLLILALWMLIRYFGKKHQSKLEQTFTHSKTDQKDH